MSTTEAASGGDDKNASFYGEDIFDDMIAKVMANSTNGGSNSGGLERVPETSTRDSPVNIEIVVENGTHPSYNNDEDGHSVSIDDLEMGERGGDDDEDDDSRNTNDDISSTNTGSDAASLDSGEISGESDISEVEDRVKSYVPQPLVNDDESTIAMKDPSPETQTVSSYVDQLNQQERRKSRLIKLGGFSILIAIIVAVILAVIMLNGNKDVEDSNNSSSVSTPTFGDTDVSMSTSTPTMQPIKLGSPIATVHPVQLTLDGIPDGYRLPEDDRTSIISFLDTLIEDNLLADEYLGDSFEVVEVAYGREGGGLPSRGPTSRRRQLLETLSLPLRIVITGPSNFSEVAVRSKIIQVIKDQTRNIEAYLRAYDYDAFKSVSLSAETYDMEDLIEPTSSPTLPPQSEQPTTALPTTAPQTNKPTLSPSQSPSIEPITRPPTAPKTSRPTTFSPVTNEPTTKKPTTEEPSTSSPTRNPTPQPSQNPTPRPTFPPVTPTPTLRPSRRPTARPISPTTPIAPYGSANSQPSTLSNPTPPSSGINQGPIAPLPVGTSNTYYCAKTSYTANWNILLDFDCELPCPSTIHTECPGGYQCHVSEYCSEVGAR